MKYLVLSALLAILTVHLPQGVDAGCGDYSSCSTCVAKVSSEGCAWCKGSNSCGLPNPFSCPDTVVLSGQCPGAVQCSAYSNNSGTAAATGCSACLDHSGEGCAFCEATGVCGLIPTLSTSCQSIRLSGNLCTADPKCSSLTACGGCLSEVGCAWCKTTMKCDSLTRITSCSDSVLAYPLCSDATMPPVGANCSQMGDCGSCVGKFATATCTWCNTTQKCTSALEVVGKCSTPAIAQPVCNAYSGNICVDQTNCSSCASKFASHTCTWCHATKKCDSAFNSLTCTSPAVSEDICVAYSGSACTNLSSCSTCVGGFARDSCTWCNSSQTCNSAINSLSCQINAVAEPVCTALAWKNCGVYADCFDCTAQATSGCGWCNSSNTCFHLQSGTCAGSVGTSGSGIVITNLQCPGQTPMPMGLPTEAECASHGSTCGLCVGKQGCVYCATSNKCLVVTDADCSPNSIKVTSDMCTAITACPSKTTCGNCTANIQDLCAWCSTTNECQPSSNQCDSPLMAAAQCPNAKASCQDHTGCGSCLAEVSGCAWCQGKCDLAFDLAACSGVVAVASSCPATMIPLTPAPTPAPTPLPPGQTAVPPTPVPETPVPTPAPTPLPVSPTPAPTPLPPGQTAVPPTPAPETPVPETPVPGTPATPAPTPLPTGQTAAPPTPAPATSVPPTPAPETPVPGTPLPPTPAPTTTTSTAAPTTTATATPGTPVPARVTGFDANFDTKGGSAPTTAQAFASDLAAKLTQELGVTVSASDIDVTSFDAATGNVTFNFVGAQAGSLTTKTEAVPASKLGLTGKAPITVDDPVTSASVGTKGGDNTIIIIVCCAVGGVLIIAIVVGLIIKNKSTSTAQSGETQMSVQNNGTPLMSLMNDDNDGRMRANTGVLNVGYSMPTNRSSGGQQHDSAFDV